MFRYVLILEVILLFLFCVKADQKQSDEKEKTDATRKYFLSDFNYVKVAGYRFVLVEIFGCEYIINRYLSTVTHKGNCKYCKQNLLIDSSRSEGGM